MTMTSKNQNDRNTRFLKHLGNLREEAQVIAQFVYADMALQYAASKSPTLLNHLNHTPRFWLTCGAALQTAGYMAIARTFDDKSKYNIHAILNLIENSLELFSKESLSARRQIEASGTPEWLESFLGRAYVPNIDDIHKLRSKVEKHRLIYERTVKPARNKYLAHREKQGEEDINKLYSGGTIKDLWKLSTFLLQFNEVIWQMYHNGRKPLFKPIRYSVKSIFDSKAATSQAHEIIVKEVKVLMSFIEKSSPKNFQH